MLDAVAPVSIPALTTETTLSIKLPTEEVTSPCTDIFGYCASEAEVIIKSTDVPRTSFSLKLADSDG